LLELGQVDPFPGKTRTMALWARQEALILFSLDVHIHTRWKISLAITIRTFTENLNFDNHMPPLIFKAKNPAIIGRWDACASWSQVFKLINPHVHFGL
jgi:hypothetical protein